MPSLFTPEDDDFEKILIVSGNLGTIKVLNAALKELNQTCSQGAMPIATFPVAYDGSILQDMLGGFRCLITDRTVRKQDPTTGLYRTVQLDTLLWDARRNGLNIIETFHPVADGSQMRPQEAKVIARMALHSVRDDRAKRLARRGK